MPYIKKEVLCGYVKEIHKHYSGRYGKKGIKRSPNKNITPEDVEKVNERNSMKNLRWAINCNFKANDYHLTLTYRKDQRPNIETSKKYLKSFIGAMRKLYRDNELELKYIYVTEFKNKAIHHHIICNYIDIRLIKKLWPYGIVRPTLLDDRKQHAALAAYLIKETRKTFKDDKNPYKRRWYGSKNLKKPIIKQKIVEADSWREHPSIPKGFYLDNHDESHGSGEHEITGYMYQWYSLIQIE